MPIKAIELRIKHLAKQKAPWSDEFTGEVYWTFKEESASILYNHFQEIEAEQILPTLLYVTSITLIPKQTQILQENYWTVSLMNKEVKVLNKTLASWTQQCKKNYNYNQVGFISVMQGCFNI